MTTKPAIHQTGFAVDSLLLEIDRQDEYHPSGFPRSRDGLRSGIAAIQDETEEALAEWRKAKRVEVGGGDTERDWLDLRAELIQIAAVAIRTAREI